MARTTTWDQRWCRSRPILWESVRVFVTNHVLSGVLVGQALRERPLTAFAAGVGSHLVLDAIPHWGSAGHSQFMRVAKRDGLLGLGVIAAAALLVDRRSRIATLSAIAGAVFLDMDKPVSIYLKFEPFPEVVNRFHRRIQRERPDAMSNEILWGALFAMLDVLTIGRRRFGPILGTTQP
jgi:hypothetical protein